MAPFLNVFDSLTSVSTSRLGDSNGPKLTDPCSHACACTDSVVEDCRAASVTDPRCIATPFVITRRSVRELVIGCAHRMSEKNEYALAASNTTGTVVAWTSGTPYGVRLSVVGMLTAMRTCAVCGPHPYGSG